MTGWRVARIDVGINYVFIFICVVKNDAEWKHLDADTTYPNVFNISNDIQFDD